MPSLVRPDSTLVTLALAAVLALGISATAAYLPKFDATGQSATGTSAVTGGGGAPVAQVNASSIWAASAPGRVKPKGGEIHVRPEAQGLIVAVHVKVNEQVMAGDPIARIKDDDALARISAAWAEVQVRLAEREEEEEKNKKLLDWRKLQDQLDEAERALHAAHVAFDDAFFARRPGESGDVLKAARNKIVEAQAKVAGRQAALRTFEAQPDLPPSTRLDSGLAIARSDLRLAEVAFDKTRIRATTSGTILDLEAKVGEMANPTSPTPIAVIGDVSQLEVTAELEERDIRHVRVGQDVVVRSAAFEAQDFAGKVVRIAPRVAPPGLGLRGSNKPRDVEILEVEIALDGASELLSGMRVDVFFKPLAETKAAAKAN